MTAPFHRVAADHWRRQGQLSFEARAILGYLLTCPHRTALQAFPVPIGYIVADTGATAGQVESALLELAEDGRIARDGDAVLIIDGHRHDPIGNTNQALHRVSLWREGGLEYLPAGVRVRALGALAEALEAALSGMSPTIKDREAVAREQVADAAAAMRAEAVALTGHSETVSEPFPNGSETVPESRAGGRAGPRARSANANANANASANASANANASGSAQDRARAREEEPTAKQMVMLTSQALALDTTVEAVADNLGLPVTRRTVTKIKNHLLAMTKERDRSRVLLEQSQAGRRPPDKPLVTGGS